MKKKMYFFVLVYILFVSCDTDVADPLAENEEEVITTLKYILTPSGGGSNVELMWEDLDGDGGESPTITSGTVLVKNTTYSGVLTLSNLDEDITIEIEEEKNEHQFFFQSTISDLKITYDDKDDNNYPIGLKSVLTTGKASSGAITIILKHEPIKTAEGVSGGSVTNSGGETDIEVIFNINVE